VDCAGAGVHVARVTQIMRTEDRAFRLENADGTMVACRRLVIATGRTAFAALKGNAMLAMHRPAMIQQVAIFPRDGRAPRSSDGERPTARSAQLMVESCANGWWYGIGAGDQAPLPVLVTAANHLPVRRCLEEWFVTGLRVLAAA
jgi:hypothetical protein